MSDHIEGVLRMAVDALENSSEHVFQDVAKSHLRESSIQSLRAALASQGKSVAQSNEDIRTKIKGYAHVQEALRPMMLDEIMAEFDALRVVTRPELAVWFGSMPESNGKTNWTAVLYRKGESGLQSVMDGITLERSEHKDRVRYEADRMRFLIGEIPEDPDIFAYDFMLGGPPAEQPSVPQHIIEAISGYGDARADDGDSGAALGNVIRLLRSWLATVEISEQPPASPIEQLISAHASLIKGGNNYAYFELAYTRQTGWMAWLTDKPLTGAAVVNPNRKVLASGGGDTPELACTEALKAVVAWPKVTP